MRGYWLAASAMYETLAISAPTVVDALFQRMSLERGNRRLARWSRRLLKHADVHLRVDGKEHIARGKAYVVMSNHSSLYDIPILFQAYPGVLRMVAKAELFVVPIWGTAMREAGFIAIDRSNRDAAIRSLNTSRQMLDRGVSVWIAPEGTRSRTGELGPFKKGGFALAHDTGLDILPVGISGTHEILPKKTASVRTGVRVRVRFGAPINATGDRDALVHKVRAEIQGLIGGS